MGALKAAAAETRPRTAVVRSILCYSILQETGMGLRDKGALQQVDQITLSWPRIGIGQKHKHGDKEK